MVHQNIPKTTKGVLVIIKGINYTTLTQSAILVLECDVYFIINGMYFHRKQTGAFGIECNFNGYKKKFILNYDPFF
jgi:hypothetical protein